MTHYYGLKNLQVFVTADVDELNQFLLEYDGNIIDIKCTNDGFCVVYRYRED